MGSRKHYSRQFRLEASRLVIERGYTYKDAAERLGATTWSIRQWVKKFREEGVFPPAGQTITEAEELKKLRQENQRLRMENDILKKAAAYFARDSL